MSEDELIDSYLKNKLDSESAIAFEKELATNDSLKKKLNLRKIIIDGISQSYADELKEKLAEFDKTLESKKRFQFSWKMAAAIAVFLTVGIGLYEHYTKPDPDDFQLMEAGLPIQMGLNDDIQFNNAMSAFKDNDFKKANETLQTLLAKNKNDTLLYFTGWCLFKTNEIQQAIKNWEQVNSESAFRDKAQYMCGVAYWKLDNKKEAITIFKQQVNSGNKDISQSANRAINSLE